MINLFKKKKVGVCEKYIITANIDDKFPIIFGVLNYFAVFDINITVGVVNNKDSNQVARAIIMFTTSKGNYKKIKARLKKLEINASIM